MTPALTVRRYEDADENAVWNVHDLAFAASPVAFDPELDRHLRRIPAAFLDAGGEFLVGTLPADAAGPGAYGPPDERVVAAGGFRPDGDRVEVGSVRVHPAFQRRGYGRTVVGALEDRARERGFDRAALETSEDLAAARALYGSLGYDRTGREYVEPADGYLVAFEKEL